MKSKKDYNIKTVKNVAFHKFYFNSYTGVQYSNSYFFYSLCDFMYGNFCNLNFYK